MNFHWPSEQLLAAKQNTISSFSTHPSTLEISWLTPPTSCYLAQIHRVRQIILFLNILNLGWPSEQVPAKQTLFPPLTHIPLPWNYLG